MKKNWIWLLLLLLFDIAFFTPCVMTVDKEITTPGGINKVDSLIEIDDTNSLKGSINTVYVTSYFYPTLMQWLITKNSKTIETDDKSIYFDLSMKEEMQSGAIQKEQSIEACLISSYLCAENNNENIKIKYEFKGFIVYLYEINQKQIKVGDLIYQVYSKKNNQSYSASTPIELLESLNNLAKDDIVYYLRDGKAYEYTLTDELDFKDKKNCFYYYPKYEIDYLNSTPKIKIHNSTTSGPSGGLLQALSVYCKITGNDLTNGKKIAGTGMIYATGYVDEIGAISQKVITCIRNKVDVFLCPKSQYEEAYKTWIKTKGHNKMKLIGVETLQEAINALEEEAK